MRAPGNGGFPLLIGKNPARPLMVLS